MSIRNKVDCIYPQVVISVDILVDDRQVKSWVISSADASAGRAWLK